MPTFTLRITGNANIPKLAEQANLRLSTSSTGRDQRTVSGDVLKTAKYIEDMICKAQTMYKDLSTTAVSHWSQTSLSTNSWVELVPQSGVQAQVPGKGIFEYRGSGSIFGNAADYPQGTDVLTTPVRYYRSTVAFIIHFQNFAVLSEFSSRLTSLEHCEIEGLTWILLPATEAHYKSELRLAATSDALNKVKDYCKLICPDAETNIAPLELVGENISGGLYSSATTTRALARGGLFGQPGNTSEQAAGSAMSFSPQEINMNLSVDFIFAIETDGFHLSSL